jgi:hypothetical protein
VSPMPHKKPGPSDARPDWWCPAVLLLRLGALAFLSLFLVRVYP